MSAAFEIEAKMVAAMLPESVLCAMDTIDAEPCDLVAEDLATLRSGKQTSAEMREHFRHEADEEEPDGPWSQYVAILEAHLAREAAK